MVMMYRENVFMRGNMDGLLVAMERPADCCIRFRSDFWSWGFFFLQVVDGAAFILALQKLIT